MKTMTIVMLLLLSSTSFASPLKVTAQPETVDLNSANGRSFARIALLLQSEPPTSTSNGVFSTLDRYVAFKGTAAELECSLKRAIGASGGTSICTVSFDSALSTPGVQITQPPAALGRIVQATFSNSADVNRLLNVSLDLKMGLAIESQERVDVTYENGATYKIPRLQVRCQGGNAKKDHTSCIFTGVLN